MPPTGGLTFAGFDVATKSALYTGVFRHQYSINTATVGDTFTFCHGDRIMLSRPGPSVAPTGRPLIVVGSSDDQLWVHDEADGVAIALRGASNFSDLLDKYGPEIQTDSATMSRRYTTQYTSPLGLRCSLLVDPDVIFSTFGVRPGDVIYLTQPQAQEVVVTGLLFNCLWVANAESPKEAYPLVGATNEATLLSLYRVYDAAASNGREGNQPTTPRQPVTPRSTKGPPYVVDAAARKVECQCAFGNKIVVSFADDVMRPLHQTHGARMMITKGEFGGKLCTILGVNSGSLYVYIEGEKKCTCLRAATTRDELIEKYGLGAAPHSSKAESARPIVPVLGLNTEQRSYSRGASPPSASRSIAASPPAVTGPQSPRGNFWLSGGGRIDIDVSDAGCKTYGFRHGDVVRCQKGADAGQRFTIAGVRNGVLHAIPEGKQRVTPLRHCFNAKDIATMFDFALEGRQSMQAFMNLNEEPPCTPRGILTPRGSEDSRPKAAPVVEARKIPTLQLGSAIRLSQEPIAEPLAAPARPSLEQPPPAEPRAAPGTATFSRYFLKAYALHRLGYSTEAAAPTNAFASFYLQGGSASARMNEAVAALSQLDIRRETNVDGLLSALNQSSQ